MKKAILNVLAVVALCVVTVLIFEGIYSIARWSKSDGSITYQAYRLMGQVIARNKRTARHSEDREGPSFTQLLERDEIDPLIPKFQAAAIGLGNSDYVELLTPAAAMGMREEGCLVQKPNLRKTLTYLRTNLFNPLDPLTMFYDRDRDLDPEIKRLVETYGVRRVAFTTNAQRERITLPAVTSDHKVIVAGDSVAAGVMVDDAETISSQLQALDPTKQYVNIGIGGATGADVICALDKAGRRYRGQIEELIYVYCENDFKRTEPYGTPREVLDWVKHFAKAQGIPKVTVVYAPYIYNIVPQFTRFRGYRGAIHPARAIERAALSELVAEAGFRYLDISEVALEEINRAKTQFAALSVFSDHVHLSPYGIARLVERLRLPY
jgi:lysophospholipase L1-like esterase